MIAIVISWTIIGVYAYLYGHVGISLLYKNKEKVLNSLDIYIVCGIMILNFYAQVFSLFYKVGLVAFCIISIGAIGCMLYLLSIDGNNIRNITKKKSKDIKISQHKVLFLVITSLSTILWTNVVPQHYDTYLYHAQAIHWIEEYGVVPGLGNLHFRLAYNSAFMTLQALFSFSWLVGQSMHTMNGFIVAFFIGYVSLSFYSDKNHVLQVSDFLKMGALVYLVYTCFYVSSPNTDTWALLLLFYICIKWSEFTEKQINDAIPYAFLCLLSVYAMTLKLSVAIFVVLTIYPAVLLVRKKQWKQIAVHLLLGVAIVAPFFIRNVIISGYLIYPYPEIDLFQFDWKMSEEIMLTDRKEITAWARGNQDISRYQDAITQWFPEWFKSIHILWRVLFVFSVVTGIILLLKVVKDIKTEKRWSEDILICTCAAGLVFWLFSAPLPRYGIVYMIFLPCIAIGIIFREEKKVTGLRKYAWMRSKLGEILFCCIIFFYSILYFPYSYLNKWGEQTVIMQNGYADRETIREEINGKSIFRASEGDRTGYNPFPSTPYLGAIEGIELRGEDFASGFRHK